ncbi:DsbA family oxidoreductase [Malikia sp.]|uniref:DsbA family oxidoreductase n=1 Tax=Malikia sp. TaxID=2070706 RepID=UPI00260CD858|nr:DsbA family oxidoreductase [Malikia sp.]MDD2728671.1 DsbA family oxidoreductase [Malikia sp.]
MSQLLKIDFISDISCPWCAIGLAALQQALERLPAAVPVSLRLQPFELAPELPPGGQDLGEMLTRKYGSTPEQQAAMQATIRQRGAEVGFEFAPEGRDRIYLTLNAHRLLHWAGTEHPERQLALKQALLLACHRDCLPMDADDVLLNATEAAGLDRERAMEILAGDEFTQEVRKLETFYRQAGVNSVPTMVVNDRYVITGSRPVEQLEQALTHIAATAPDA